MKGYPLQSSDKETYADRNLGGAPKGNANAVKHGIYSKRLAVGEERELHDSLLVRFRKDFSDTDDSLLREAALYVVRLKRALDSGNMNGIEKMDSRLRKALKQIRFPMPAVSSESASMTREEWIAGFLAGMSGHSEESE